MFTAVNACVPIMFRRASARRLVERQKPEAGFRPFHAEVVVGHEQQPVGRQQRRAFQVRAYLRRLIAVEQQRFGQYFRNYGYASLSAQNLEDYHTAILPASQFQRQAGKTDAALPIVTKRAINDPRGSLVNTAVAQAPTDSNPSVAEPISNETDSGKGQVEAASAQSASPSQNHLSYQAGSVGAWIVARLGEQGHALI